MKVTLDEKIREQSMKMKTIAYFIVAKYMQLTYIEIHIEI